MNGNCIMNEFQTSLSPMMWEGINEQIKLEEKNTLIYIKLRITKFLTNII